MGLLAGNIRREMVPGSVAMRLSINACYNVIAADLTGIRGVLKIVPVYNYVSDGPGGVFVLALTPALNNTMIYTSQDGERDVFVNPNTWFPFSDGTLRVSAQYTGVVDLSVMPCEIARDRLDDFRIESSDFSPYISIVTDLDFDRTVAEMLNMFYNKLGVENATEIFDVFLPETIYTFFCLLV